MTIDSSAAVNRESVTDRRAQFRYGAVFLLTSAAVVFVIAAPSADWSRAVTMAIESAALVVAVATSRERERVRHRRALAVGIVMIVLILGVGIGGVSEQLTAILLALVTAAVPVAIVRGVVRLLRERGVTLQAVAEALAIYLSIGLVFAWIISFFTHVDSAAYFAQHTSGSEGDRVYFSFTVLTTTGFGDFRGAVLAPAVRGRHSLRSAVGLFPFALVLARMGGGGRRVGAPCRRACARPAVGRAARALGRAGVSRGTGRALLRLSPRPTAVDRGDHHRVRRRTMNSTGTCAERRSRSITPPARAGWAPSWTPTCESAGLRVFAWRTRRSCPT